MKYDVIICGAGPAGTAAAITAARQGLNVCLIERYGFAGGMATSALVNPWLGHGFSYPNDNKRYSLIGGFFLELAQTLYRENAIANSNLSVGAFDDERLKCIYDRLLTQSGVKLLFHSMLIGAKREGNSVKEIEIVSKGGIEKIEGRYFIDATGDGDLANFASCDYQVGRPRDGLTQAMTVSFRMGNVDKTEMIRLGNLTKARLLVEPYFQEARANKSLNYPYREFVQFFDYPQPGVLHFNMTRINRVSGLSNEDLTHAEIEGRRQAVVISDWLRNTVPCFKNAFLMKIAAQVGVRETRHIKGLYTVSREDIVMGKKFSDAIVRSAYFIDIHSPTGSGDEHAKQGTRGVPKKSFCPPRGDYYEVPYRSIVPAGIDNLLVACRALSATHEGEAAIRVMATMTGIGQAGGLAVKQAVQTNTNFPEINGEIIRRKLEYLDQEPTQFLDLTFS